MDTGISSGERRMPAEGMKARVGVVACFLAVGSVFGSGGVATMSEVSSRDPVFPDRPATQRKVLDIRDDRGFPVGYAMDIVAEVCLDAKCKVVKATLYWNAAGGYDRIETPPGMPLTKKEHDPFTRDDYDRLDEILADRDSVLRDHTLAYLAKEAEAGENAGGVDGVSGATPGSVRDAVVKDAAWTTWVLWHYVNGEIVPQLRDMTRKSASPAYVKHLFASPNPDEIDFALDLVETDQAVSPQFANDVLHVVQTGTPHQVERAVRVLDLMTGDKKALHRNLIESMPRMNPNHMPLVIDFLVSQPNLPEETLEHLTRPLDQMPYYPVHLALQCLEKRRFFSGRTEQDVARLLDHKEFFIARRADEFLSKHQPELAAGTIEAMKAFRDRHPGRMKQNAFNNP
jgi:hypothetical protein